jgi:hypothetical protein
MSYEIYYDRAFIKVGENFVPLVNEGSNNTFDINYAGREIPEKNWQVLNWRNRNKLLYTTAEVREIAHDYEQISQSQGDCFKSRNRAFGPKEFERWILCGLKSAHTIEEYVSYGNRLQILDYSGDTNDWKRIPFSTTREFLDLLEQLKDCKLLNVKFTYDRKVYRPKKERKKPERLTPKDLDEYYVLTAVYQGGRIYFSALLRSGIRFTYSPAGLTRIFKCEHDAVKYLDKYKRRFSGTAFEAKKMKKDAA